MSQQINLFNPIFLKQQKVFSLLTMIQALGLIIAGSIVFYGYAWHQVEQLTLQYHESDKRFKKGEANLQQITEQFSPEKTHKLLREQVKSLEKQQQDQAETVNALKSGSVGNTIGYSSYMQAFSRQLVNGLWLTEFVIVGDGAQIRLNGGMLSADLLPAYLQRLSQESVMQGRTFSGLDMQQFNYDPAKEAAAEQTRIAAEEAKINAQWATRPASPKAQREQQKALAAARVPSPPPIDYITFSLHSDAPTPNTPR